MCDWHIGIFSIELHEVYTIDGDPKLCLRTYSNIQYSNESEQSGRRKGAQGLYRGAQGFGARQSLNDKHKHTHKVVQAFAQG